MADPVVLNPKPTMPIYYIPKIPICQIYSGELYVILRILYVCGSFGCVSLVRSACGFHNTVTVIPQSAPRRNIFARSADIVTQEILRFAQNDTMYCVSLVLRSKPQAYSKQAFERPRREGSRPLYITLFPCSLSRKVRSPRIYRSSFVRDRRYGGARTRCRFPLPYRL